MKTTIIITAMASALSFGSLAAPSNQGPLNIDTWQQQRHVGQANMPSFYPNMMAVNPQDVFEIDHQKRDYDLHEIPSVARILSHPATGAVVIMNKDGDVLLEQYRNGHDRNTTFANQSSTKTIGYILLQKALAEGKISLDDKVEKYIPSIGSGFRGRTVGDVANMNVNHDVAELAAYTGDPQALANFDKDERVIGMQRNDERLGLRDWIESINAMGMSNEWKGDIANYATINTSVVGWLVEAATGVSLQQQVRELFHEVGGENTMFMGTDFEGTPVIGASMMLSAVDFARYGRLLIADPAAAKNDIKQAKKLGQPVPAELTYVDSSYYKSAIINQYGLGHSGWAGQLIWADPESGVIIAVNSMIQSELPAPYDHFNKIYNAATDIVKHERAKQAK
ncbi:serine hydrolase [Vibrio sp. ZSDZ34]|uniref:Serine hydrolase n=1 Tax=Vibrio gelatinilyticus TaxID=2893468 RepID=A0A9X1WCD3_9VIBR|nr:serine hydrolase [Vibrio gelatinilyticus]MCJ2376050.1 serine hydrolase [Vibrio gelatinilyticus]